MQRFLQCLSTIIILIHAASVLAEDDDIDVEAAAGSPFGVCKIVVHKMTPRNVRPDEFRVVSGGGRILYPVVEIGGAAEAGADWFGMYFLFRGDESFGVKISSPYFVDKPVTISPEDKKSHQRKLLKDWWRAYTAHATQVNEQDSGPTLVENYATAMLARRLKLEPPKPPWSWGSSSGDELAFLIGAESVRSAMRTDLFLKDADSKVEADQALPEAVLPLQVELPEPASDAVVEPLAMHVPEECFYLRSGSFADFQWLRRTADEWGGNLRNMIAIRGVDYRIKAKLERQLALKETALAKLLGGVVIDDMAVIGTDTFVREGSAMGILFHAKNSGLLATQLTAQRTEAQKASESAELSDVEIGERKVSKLATSDNRVRSYYVADGDYHLVTNSSSLVARFLEAGAGKRALGSTKEFRYARTKMPLSRNDTLFVYLSDAFFRNLVSPAYRIEMTRRLRAITEIELSRLAVLSARAEDNATNDLKELIKRGYLPETFGRRSDGSHVVGEKDTFCDSLRGGLGTFLPIPDAAVDRATKDEIAAYKSFSETYRREWERIDPVVLALKKTDLEKGRERVEIDVHILPYAKARYGSLSLWMGAPTTKRIAPGSGVIASVAYVTPGTHYFAGMFDFLVPFLVKNGEVVHATHVDELWRGYCGAWNTSGAASVNFFNPPEKLDKDGYGKSETDWRNSFWYRKLNDFHFIATSKETLGEISNQLKVEDAPRAAQVRLHIGDLSEAKVRRYLDTLAYVHAHKISNGNLRFLNTLIDQLHVNPAAGIETAQALLDAELVCPLGGEYKIDGQRASWTAPKSASWYNPDEPPADYHFPFIDWCRSLDLEFSIDSTSITTHTEMELQTSKEK